MWPAKPSIHRDGFGFLIPDARRGHSRDDVFLPPGEARKGHARRSRAGPHHPASAARAGRKAKSLRILRRAHVTVVGEFRVKKRGNFVVPSDERIQQWIEIPEGMELPATMLLADRVGAVARAR